MLTDNYFTNDLDDRTIYSETELYEMFDDYLNESTDFVKVHGMTYSPSYVLKEVDPIAYRTIFNDWLDGEGYQEFEDGYIKEM